MSELSDCPRLRAAQSDINEDLHAAELKYTVFNVMVLIVAACLLGLICNLSTIQSNNSTYSTTNDLFRLYVIRSKQLFLNN